MKRVGADGYTPCRRAVLKPLDLAPEASVNLKKWISWDTFRALPPTLQKLYVQTQMDKYRVGIGILALAWGKSDAAVRSVLDLLDIRVPPGTRKADKQRFMAFIKGDLAEAAVGAPHQSATLTASPEGEALEAREGNEER